MDFNSQRPIYLQIADVAINHIIAGEWLPDRRIPSVRELAVEMAVNTHTVLKAMDHLVDHGIIAPRRGMGYFLEPQALERVTELRRSEFYNEMVPVLLERMRQLSITPEELFQHIKKI